MIFHGGFNHEITGKSNINSHLFCTVTIWQILL